MSQLLTEDYLLAHMTDNEEHFHEAGKLLSNAIFEDAIAWIREHGAAEVVTLSPKIELTVNHEEKCTTVTWTRPDGSTLSYHRPR